MLPEFTNCYAQILQKLLDRDPNKRPGVKNPDDLKNHPFFDGINWKKLERKETVPPHLEPIEDEELAVPIVSHSQGRRFYFYILKIH